jgi:uncharacterized membrane protein YkoI
MSIFPKIAHSVLLPAVGGLLLFVSTAVEAQRLSRGEMTTRPVTDQERALDKSQNRELIDFGTLLARAERLGQGRYVGVETNIHRGVYRFKFMRAGGQVVWVDMDARTGAVLGVR